MPEAEVVCLPSVLLDRLYQSDLDTLWAGAPLCGGGARGVWVLLRRLEPIERSAWDAHHPRFAVGIIADESEGGGHLARSLVLRPDDTTIPADAVRKFDIIERSERVSVQGAFISLHWDAADAGGAA